MSRIIDLEVLKKELNEEQFGAASKVDGPMLILAGAGSGKTRAITYKIAHLISHHQVDARRILAVTFTNKAAKEMRHRIGLLLEVKHVPLDWMGTFHSICVRMLRLCLGNPQVIGYLGWGYNKNFSIYDDDDQRRLLKDIVKPHLGEDLDAAALRKIHSAISRFKNDLGVVKTPQGDRLELQTPERVKNSASFGDEEQMAMFYAEYQKRLMDANAMDYDDLLWRTVEMFQKIPAVAQQFAHRFQYAFVDEYQDTNNVQYALLRSIIDPVRKNVTVVGDDDQSIYGWRGANIGIIRNFSRDFAPVQMVKLEQNYRSTATIVKAAGSVIAKNERPAEMRKEVFSRQEEGDKVLIRKLGDDRAEAESIAKAIVAAGPATYANTAVFYRTNAQSRVLEKAMNDHRLPNVIFGGTRFWDRKEVRDVLSYLRLLSNPKDEAAVLRVINVPPRGIGKTTVEQLQQSAREQGVTLWDALCSTVKQGAGRLAPKLVGFHTLVQDCLAQAGQLPIPLLAEKIISDTRYKEFLREDDATGADDRIANVDEMINALREFDEEHPDATLDSFLQDISLLTDADSKSEQAKDRITLMTMHMAKGLEYDIVHIAGCDEYVFPLVRRGAMEMQTPAEKKAHMEEERRLFYVGATRAKKQLSLYTTARRFWQGSIQPFHMSRFLEEMDPDTLNIEEDVEYSENGQASPGMGSFGQGGFGAKSGYGGNSGGAPRTGGYPGSQSGGSGNFGNKTYDRSYGSGNARTHVTGGGSKPVTIRTVYKDPLPSGPSKPKEAGPQVVYDEYSQENLSFAPGMKVRHARFGTGRVLSSSGSGENTRVEVQFHDGTVRKLILKYASLDILGER